MPLNIEVKGDPASIQETADWLRSMAGEVGDTGTHVVRARGNSESAWEGDAAESFRRVAQQTAQAVDELETDYRGTQDALDVHASDLATVKSRMTEAAGVARDGGLEVTATQIMEPGPAPPAPTPLPTDRPATATEAQGNAAATQAQSAYAAKVATYQECSRIVIETRETEISSQRRLLDALGKFANKTAFTIAGVSTGLAAETVKRTSKFRAVATTQAAKAARAANLMHSPNLSFTNQTKAAVIHAQNSVDAAGNANKATATRVARVLDRMPNWAKKSLTAQFDFHQKVTPTTRIIGKATPVLKRVPVVGTGITAAGVAYDIQQGEDPTKAVVKGASSLATGVAVGAMIGGPAGVVVGGLVGWGAGAAIDRWG